MVSTRQMTGATTEESTLYLFRSSAANSSSSSQPSSNNRSATTSTAQSHSSGSVSATNVHGSGVAGAVVTVHSSPQQPPPYESLNLLDLPVEILGHIFSYVGYKKVAQMRVVS